MPTIQVRGLPDHIYRKIVEQARAKRSSITQETIYLLQKSLDIDESKREQRKALVEKMQQNPVANAESLPDPVSLIREDRDR